MCQLLLKRAEIKNKIKSMQRKKCYLKIYIHTHIYIHKQKNVKSRLTSVLLSSHISINQ